jgi:NAD(P)-dependent dehydrogenase (short-subunit alcohol dehydrogenase family)
MTMTVEDKTVLVTGANRGIGGSRVELYAAIRGDARTGLSNRALPRKYGVGYRTVAAALESACR